MVAKGMLLLYFLALSIVQVLGYGYYWKECTWRKEDPKDQGIIWACEFQKQAHDTGLPVYYSGNIRISGCHHCCTRWYFTFNGVECSTPGAIDGALYQAHAGNLNKHEHGHIEGHCHHVPAGRVNVEVRIGPCTGTGLPLGNGHTGFATLSRIFI
ncbi:Collagen triple helix repeat-containing protein 1 [Stylophora pistillata]|uniref:Collagen triple helix repeat-containing protein 1 n=1 Tax=Stylophora pistillata TaxID=50429 RepID=A0A2B4SNS2_STYPI|nr:Collagen triple helix repeat-containing protein 1 [Stylophora pistillata]